LKGRDEVTLQPILKWLNKAIGDPRIIRLASDVSLMVLDIYSEQLGQSAEIDTLVERLRERVLDNVEVSQLAGSTQGMLEMLMAGT
jgi:U3 small nucleolar RNA-associated protein 15